MWIRLRTALVPLCIGIFVAAAAALAGPAPAAAQDPCISCPGGGGGGSTIDTSPPGVVIGDGQTSYTGSGPAQEVAIEIVYCSSTPGLTVNAPGRRVFFDGMDVTGRFPGAYAQGNTTDCVQRYVANGTLPMGPGTHRVVSYIGNAFAADTAVVDYTYQLAAHGVAVTPDRAVAGFAAGTPHTQVFTVRNTGTVTDTYSMSMSCPNGLAYCALSPTQVTLAPGAEAAVTASYTVQYAGLASQMTVTAARTADPLVKDQGSLTVSAPVASGAQKVPLVNVPLVNPGGTPTPALCLTMPAGPGAEYQCGDLRLVEPLPTVRTLGQSRTPALVYHTQHASPYPVVRAQVTVDTGAASPTSIEARLYNASGVEVTAARRSYDGQEWIPGFTRQIAIGWSDPALATGFHSFSLQVTSWYGTTARTATVPVTVGVVNRRNSVYGRGWWVAGLEKLDVGSMTWVGGDGALRRYTAVPGQAGAWVAPSVSHPDTLRAVDSISVPGIPGEARYARLLPGGGRVYFDLLGRHVATADPQGRWTRFFYNASHGGLDSIRVPTGIGRNAGRQSHRFLYDGRNTPGGWVSILTQVWSYNTAGQPDRGTFLTHHAVDRVSVVGIQDPLGTAVGFAYDSAVSGRVVERTDQRGTPTRWRFNAAGKLAEARSEPGHGMAPSVVQWDPMESRGWTQSTREAQTRIDGARTDVVDVTLVTHNALGAPTRIVDALGNATDVAYSTTFPALAVHTRSPRGAVSVAEYDAMGRLLSTTDSSTFEDRDGTRRYNRTSYAYEDARHPHRATHVTDAYGKQSITGYNADGTVQWVQDARGDSTRVTYHYDAATGLLASVRSVTDSIQDRLPERFAYDSLGNLARHISPAGDTMLVRTDRLGRVVRSIEPRPFNEPVALLDSAYTATTYDALDRVVTTETWGPSVRFDRQTTGVSMEPQIEPARRLWVRNYYNAVSQLDSVARWSDPDPTSIGRMVTRWAYDGMGRVIRETAGDGAVEQRAYDPAGNLTGVVTRRGFVNEVAYDALGRVARRVTPGVSYPHSTVQADNDTQWVFPYYAQVGPGVFGTVLNLSSGVSIAADTAVFAYDSAGSMTVANNADARITREYNVNGTLKRETQRIRTYLPGTAAWDRAYTLDYDYDAMGRRTAVHHPVNLRPDGLSTTRPVGATRWWYGASGALDSVNSVTGGIYRFHYDANGALRWRESWSNEYYTYDADGRTTRRLHTFSSQTIHDDTITYVAGRPHHVVSQVRGLNAGSLQTVTSRVRYNGLGGMAHSAQISSAGTEFTLETYTLDAFANQKEQTQVSLNYVTNGGASSEVQRFGYQAGTGRQVLQQDGNGNSAGTTAFDASGNVILATSQEWMPTPYTITTGGGPWYRSAGSTSSTPMVLLQATASYFGADERLRVLDKRACMRYGNTCYDEVNTPYNGRSAFEEYRYDALGRRVLTRTRADYACHALPESVSTCLKAVIRTVWDGDQILYEISAPGAANNAAVLENDSPPPPQVKEFSNPHGFFAYGRVAYTHGGGIDAPISVIRIGFSELFPGPVEFEPFVNWSGKYDGGSTPCMWVNSTRTSTQLRDNVQPPFAGDPDPYTKPDAEGGFNHCVEADWPARALYNTLERRDHKLSRWGGPVSWMGSLIQHGRDASGQYYRRNRYYDASTGRFTQEDPIGLAGGVNLYGFGGGNPISNADPYGLSSCPVEFGGDGKTEEFDDCPAGSPGWYANRVANEEGSTFLNTLGGVLSSCGHSSRCMGVLLKGMPGAKRLFDRAVKQSRDHAVRAAWRDERALVGATGEGTRAWSPEEKNELLTQGRVRGYAGHHINDVAENLHLAGNPDNIMFVREGKEHLDLHGGCTRNSCSGPLLDRSY